MKGYKALYFLFHLFIMFATSIVPSFPKSPRKPLYSPSETPGPGRYGVNVSEHRTVSVK